MNTFVTRKNRNLRNRARRHRGGRWNRRDTMLFLERVELYISSGLSLDRTLSIIEQGIPAKQAAQIRLVHADIQSGVTLAASLTDCLRMSSILTGLIEHGERSGGLAPALLMARKLVEQQDEISKKVMSALAYPVVIGVFASLLAIGLVRGVMPQIIPMLKSLHVALPLLTRVTIFISEHAVTYGIPALLGAIGLFTVFTFFYRKIRFFKRMIQMVFLQIPLIGKLIYVYAVSLFLRSCGALVDSGISVVTAYSEAASTISFIPLSDQVHAQQLQVAKGIPIGSILGQISRKIPRYIPPLVTAGEASGTLGASLLRAADIIDRDIDHSLKRLTSLVEPVMMVGMGGMVGAIALSIMMPIYDISKTLQH